MARVFGASAIALCSLVIIILNFSYCFNIGLEESHVYSKQPDITSYSLVAKLREKRQPVTNQNNQHESRWILSSSTNHHNYYNTTIYVDKIQTDKLWDYIKTLNHNSILSESHRGVVNVDLSFDFPFYGQPVRNMTVTTGGFLTTGEYIRSGVNGMHSIAPCLGNFDTRLSDDSFVKFFDNGTAFTAIWENVSLQGKPDVGKFTFSATLHKNGDIVFIYYNVPALIGAIHDGKPIAKVGLSDSYIMDKVIFFETRKVLYEYHRVNFDISEITNSTVIFLKALPTCSIYKDCNSCLNHDTPFDCAWCPILNRCSTGADRREWLLSECDKEKISNDSFCPAIRQEASQIKSNVDQQSSGHHQTDYTDSAD